MAKALLHPPLLVIGLTGGIASGKSTASRAFAALGAHVIDADQTGRDVAAPGEPALAEIVAGFGPEYLQADGTLNRRALGSKVFGDRVSLQKLNRIMFPRIAAALRQEIEALQGEPPAPPIVVLEAAVLLEAGWIPMVDHVVVVRAQQSTQTARLIAERGLQPAAAEARVRSQPTLSERLKHAHHTLDGEGGREALEAEARVLWAEWLRLLNRETPQQAGGKSRSIGQ